MEAEVLLPSAHPVATAATFIQPQRVRLFKYSD
jgi:hypothetical protein